MVKGRIKWDNEEVGLESATFVRGRNSWLNKLIGLKNVGGLSWLLLDQNSGYYIMVVERSVIKLKRLLWKYIWSDNANMSKK